MSLLFNEISNAQLQPGIFIEIDPTTNDVSVSTVEYRVLLVGQKLAAGTSAVETVEQILSKTDADAKYGAGSHMANMAEAYFAGSPGVTLYGVCQEDETGSTAATSTITIVGTATENASYILYVGGRRIVAPVVSGDSETDIATAIVAAVTAEDDLSVNAESALGVVTLTARNKGTLGNSIFIEENHYEDESLPAGITTTIVQMTGGATNPTMSNFTDAITDDDWFQYVIGGYTASAEILEFETFLRDRFVATVAMSGVYYSGLFSSVGLSDFTTYGDGRNSTHSSIMPLYNVPTTPWEFASAVVSAISPKIRNRQSVNLANTAIPFVVPAKKEYQFDNDEKNQLLGNGISTYNYNADGTASIGKVISTYQTNTAGVVDDHFRDIQSFYNVQYLRFDQKVVLASTYQGFNLTDDVVGNLPPKTATPSTIASTLENRMFLWESLGLIENATEQIKTINVVRNETNQNRVDYRIEVDLANQLEVFAGQLGFQV